MAEFLKTGNYIFDRSENILIFEHVEGQTTEEKNVNLTNWWALRIDIISHDNVQLTAEEQEPPSESFSLKISRSKLDGEELQIDSSNGILKLIGNTDMRDFMGATSSEISMNRRETYIRVDNDFVHITYP